MYIVTLLVSLGYDNLVIIIVNTNVINNFHQLNILSYSCNVSTKYCTNI